MRRELFGCQNPSCGCGWGTLCELRGAGAPGVSEVLSKINPCKQDIALNNPNIKQVSINLESNHKGNCSELSLYEKGS